MSTPSTLGPIACGVLLARDIDSVTTAYQRYLELAVTQRFRLDEATAAGLGLQALAGQSGCLLAGGSGRAWLMVIAAATAAPRDALTTHGWLSQEVLVADVDRLAARLAGSPFEVLRPPANLAVSERIRACQVRGPAGEILYLTQVNGAVPPFELPTCRAAVDHLFIAVLSTPDRDAALADYQRLAGREGLRFDTRISVANRALGLPLEQRHPVGTVQLAGNALIEIDQIETATAAPAELCAGTALMVFEAGGTPPREARALSEGPFAGRFMAPLRGRAGERAALLYTC